MTVDPEGLRALIRDIPDWPRAGVTFHDITPLLADSRAFREVVDGIADHFARGITDAGGPPVTRVVGVEARGFILAAPVALRLDAGFVPVRKGGRLPAGIEAEEYTLEYGNNLLEVRSDCITTGDRVLIVDDVLATGATAAATIRLVERLGARVEGLACLLELRSLGGRQQLGNHPVHSLVTIDDPAVTGQVG